MTIWAAVACIWISTLAFVATMILTTGNPHWAWALAMLVVVSGASDKK